MFVNYFTISKEWLYMLSVTKKNTYESNKDEVTQMIDSLAEKGQEALKELSKKSQQEINDIVHQMSMAAVDQHMHLAKLAYDETGRGIYEDKAIKNLYASEYIWNSIKDNKTVGIIGEDKQKGLTYVAEPIGVICGVTPTTNPTSTTIFKAMIAIKTGNPIIFAFHPSTNHTIIKSFRTNDIINSTFDMCSFFNISRNITWTDS